MFVRNLDPARSEQKSPATLGLSLPIRAFLLGVLVLSTVASCGSATRTFQRSNASAPASAEPFSVGERSLYSLDYVCQGLSDISALFGEVTPAEQESAGLIDLKHTVYSRVTGDLAMTVVDRSAEELHFACEVRRAQVLLVIDGSDRADDAERLRIELARTIHVNTDVRGRIRALRFDPDTNKATQDFGRAILAAVQFVRPPDAAARPWAWEVEEDSPAGPLRVRYDELPAGAVAVSHPSSQSIWVRKTTIADLAEPEATTGQLEIESDSAHSGHLVAELEAGSGRLIALSGRTSQEVRLNRKPVSTAHSDLRLERVGTEKLVSTELLSLRRQGLDRARRAAGEPLALSTSDEGRRAVDRARLGDATLESLLSELDAIDAPVDVPIPAKLYLSFETLLRVQPEAAPALGRMLADADPESRRFHFGAEVLAGVGDEAAQVALAIATRSRGSDWPALQTLIPLLGGLQTPTEESEELLTELAESAPDENIASTAQLALGALARNLERQHPVRADRLVDWAIEHLKNAASAELRQQWLLVLGNAGSARALPWIENFLSDAEPAVRKSAVFALRFDRTSEATHLMIHALLSDVEPSVRLNAAWALSWKGADPVVLAAVQESLRSDGEEDLRLAALRILWDGRAALPQAAELVRRAAESDPSESVRQAALQIVAGNPREFPSAPAVPPSEP